MTLPFAETSIRILDVSAKLVGGCYTELAVIAAATLFAFAMR